MWLRRRVGVFWTDIVTQPRPRDVALGPGLPNTARHPPGNGGMPASTRLPHSQGGPTRGASGWVLCATISSSCCWSGLTEASPEEGSGLPELVLEELTGASLGARQKLGYPLLLSWGSVCHTQRGALGAPRRGQ